MLIMKVKNRLLNYENMFIYQNPEYFTFSLDSVLLTNFVTINYKDKAIIDFATGNAPIAMLLNKRCNKHIIGIELQTEIYKLAVESVNINKMSKEITLINDNIKNISSYYDLGSIDVIVCNPPYFRCNDSSLKNSNEVKAIARHEINITLEEIIFEAGKMLKNGGHIALVHVSNRFSEVVDLMKKYNIEPKVVRFVYPKSNKNSNVFLIEGYKNGKKGMKILPPLIVYDDCNQYCEEIRLMFGGNENVAE